MDLVSKQNVLSLNMCHFTSCEISVLNELDQLIFGIYIYIYIIVKVVFTCIAFFCSIVTELFLENLFDVALVAFARK